MGRDDFFFFNFIKFLDDGLDINSSLKSDWYWDFPSPLFLSCFMNSWALLLIHFSHEWD